MGTSGVGLGGCGATRGPRVPGALARPPPSPPGDDRLVSWVTALFLFIGTLSGLIIRSLPRLLLLAIAGK